MNLVTCETTAAIALHLRDTSLIGSNFSGHAMRPAALCGVVIAWDTKIPLSGATCNACIKAAKSRNEPR